MSFPLVFLAVIMANALAVTMVETSKWLHRRSLERARRKGDVRSVDIEGACQELGIPINLGTCAVHSCEVCAATVRDDRVNASINAAANAFATRLRRTAFVGNVGELAAMAHGLLLPELVHVAESAAASPELASGRAARAAADAEHGTPIQ